MLPSGAEIQLIGIEAHQSYALVVSVPEEMPADKLASLRQGLYDITDRLHDWWAGEEKFCNIVVRKGLILRFERTDDAVPRPAVVADLTAVNNLLDLNVTAGQTEALNVHGPEARLATASNPGRSENPPQFTGESVRRIDGFGHPMSYRYDPAEDRTEHGYDG